MTTDREAQLLVSAYQAGISSPEELANFMAQVGVESRNLNSLNEGFAYTRGIRQITVDANVTSALREGPEALEAARVAALRGEPERLAELMYGGRMGNDEPGDGYKYHGRGYMQLTGKNQYSAAGEALGLDLVNQPDLAAQPEHAAKIAVLYWQTNIPPDDRENVARAGGRINTGNPNQRANHADRRQAQYEDWVNALTPEVIERLSQGDVAVPITPIARSESDPVIESLQQNLNILGIRDARGQPLVTDGDRGGTESRTNEAIAAFQRQAGLSGEMGNAELLAATQATLTAQQGFDFAQPLRGIVPEATPPPRMVNGTPDYLLPGRTTGGPNPSAEPDRVPPMPPVAQLQPGDNGAAVFALQQHLRVLKANDASGRQIEADRDYGGRTREAIENFQLWTGLSTTGIADRATLDALKEHVSYALEQRAKGIAPAANMVENLKPSMQDPAWAAEDRAVQRLGTIEAPVHAAPTKPAVLPYSDPSHPKHALYAELKSSLEGLGYRLPEDRLHQITGQMDLNGMRPGPQNRYAVRDDTNMFYASSDIPGYRAHQSLGEPVPAVEQIMQQVLAQQQALELTRGTDAPERSGPTR